MREAGEQPRRGAHRLTAGAHPRAAGRALDTLWVTTLNGAKLSAAAAAAVADRLSDMLNDCTSRGAEPAAQLSAGDVCVCNADAHEECTLIKVIADPHNNGQLLEIASTLSGLGITIREADMENHDGTGTWVFRVLSAKGTKLEYPEASSLLFLLSNAAGRGAGRLQPRLPV